MEMCYDGALVMPSSYAVMDEDEMMYVEGGKYYSRSQCGTLLAMTGVSPSTYIALTLTYVLAKSIITAVATAFGNVAGWALSVVLTAAASQVIRFGQGICYGALNNGVDITWNWNILKTDIGVNVAVHY